MLRILFLTFALSVSAYANNAIVLETRDLLKIPSGVKGDFTVAATPPRVEAILFTGLPQSEKGTLWSSWGNGLFASNKKYYTAIGDHRGYDGNSHVYEYNPSTGSLTKIVDVAQSIGQQKEDYGHGKIHAQIHEYKKRLYFATYWGTLSEVEEALSKGYKGSLFFSLGLRTKKLKNLGNIAPGEGLPASCLDRVRGLLYFYAVQKGDLLVYDLNKRAVKFKGGSTLTAVHRSFMQARDGKVYFSDSKGRISFYDPLKNSIFQTSLTLPGSDNALRAAARATSDGRIFGMTNAGLLFEFNPGTNTIKNLGPNFLSGDYTAVMVLSPDQKYLYFAPGSHGSAAKFGTPIVQYDIAGGTRKVIAFLRDPLIKATSYYIAGNYNMQIDSKGEVLYCTFNGSDYTPNKDQETFGLPSIVTVKIPSIERQ